MKTIAAIFVAGFGLVSLISCKPKGGITQEEMVRRTQELFDAVTAGDQTPAKKYYADDCMFFDEKGRNMNTAALVADITPLPKGFSGSIAVGKVQSHIDGGVAILSYDLDEKEAIYGQNLTARYHETDTWLRRDGIWQIIAGQAFRYYEDPAAGTADIAKYRDYAGTYELAPTVTLVILKEGDQLYRQRSERPREMLVPEAPDIFFRKGVEGRIVFRRGDNGKVDASIDRRNNEDVVWKKVK